MKLTLKVGLVALALIISGFDPQKAHEVWGPLSVFALQAVIFVAYGAWLPASKTLNHHVWGGMLSVITPVLTSLALLAGVLSLSAAVHNWWSFSRLELGAHIALVLFLVSLPTVLRKRGENHRHGPIPTRPERLSSAIDHAIELDSRARHSLSSSDIKQIASETGVSEQALDAALKSQKGMMASHKKPARSLSTLSEDPHHPTEG